MDIDERSIDEVAKDNLKSAIAFIVDKQPERKIEMAERKKIEHFWISNELADQFIDWCKEQDELEELPVGEGQFTPERARFKFTSPKFGFTQTFMLYNKEKYNCVNLPQNARAAYSTFASDEGLEMPSGTLGTARGDGRDDSAIAAARSEKAEEKAAAKAERDAVKKEKANAAAEKKAAAKTKTESKKKAPAKKGGKASAKA